MADMTKNSGGTGNRMTREEELTLAWENSRKAHKEQQAMLIDALRRNGVQIVVETNGSLVMVEDETPETVISTPLNIPRMKNYRFYGFGKGTGDM